MLSHFPVPRIHVCSQIRAGVSSEFREVGDGVLFHFLLDHGPVLISPFVKREVADNVLRLVPVMRSFAPLDNHPSLIKLRRMGTEHLRISSKPDLRGLVKSFPGHSVSASFGDVNYSMSFFFHL